MALQDYCNFQGVRGAVLFNDRGHIVERTAGFGSDDVVSDITRLIASVQVVYQRGNEPIQDLAFEFDSQQIWITSTPKGFVAVITDKTLSLAQVQSVVIAGNAANS
ncbi:MAG: hypothetical protein SGI71_07265 [Verrucomicrobiota bacterium]|nr:hypothetical protein [Verrucomicrobiota bacterium]